MTKRLQLKDVIKQFKGVEVPIEIEYLEHMEKIYYFANYEEYLEAKAFVKRYATMYVNKVEESADNIYIQVVPL